MRPFSSWSILIDNIILRIPIMADKAASRAKFEGVFAAIREELLQHFAGEGMPAEAVEWYRKVR